MQLAATRWTSVAVVLSLTSLMLYLFVAVAERGEGIWEQHGERVIRRYGVLDETWNLAKRSYFMIDRQGVVRFKQIFDDPVQVLTNEELLVEVRRLAE